MKRLLRLTTFFLSLFLFSSLPICETILSISHPFSSKAIAAAPTNEPAWKAEWNKTVMAAKQEGKVAIYTTYGPGDVKAMKDGFEHLYGINLEFVPGRGAELREKLFTVRRAGLYLADTFLMGAAGMLLDLKPAGVLDPLKPQLILPEVVDPTVWYGGGILYNDKERSYSIAFCFSPQPGVLINTKLVNPGDVEVYADLLQPRWKGKIVINDPTTTGAGQEWFQMVSKALGFGFMRELAKQEPAIIRDLRLQVEWVARGKYSVLLGPQGAAEAEFIKAGAPIGYLSPSDGAYAGPSAGNIALINKAAHPNAAKVFINWLLSREGQTVMSKSLLIQSARLDVPTNHLDPVKVRKPGISYINSADENIVLERGAVVKEAANVFAAGR